LDRLGHDPVGVNGIWPQKGRLNPEKVSARLAMMDTDRHREQHRFFQVDVNRRASGQAEARSRLSTPVTRRFRQNILNFTDFAGSLVYQRLLIIVRHSVSYEPKRGFSYLVGLAILVMLTNEIMPPERQTVKRRLNKRQFRTLKRDGTLPPEN
jgi:hypothetical protein